MLWSQGRMMKQQPWEESIHVPLILRWPGTIPAGRVVEGLIGLVDLMPTLLGLAGVEVPAGVQGANLSRLIRGGSAVGREEVYIYDLVTVDQSHAQGIPEWRGVRTDRHTYARTREGPWLLYDTGRDPHQLENLVGRPEVAGVQAVLEAAVQRWLAATGDRFVAGPDLLAAMDLAEQWNARERELHPRAPRLVPAGDA
jgi:arylsulfatase A-like enzyme